MPLSNRPFIGQFALNKTLVRHTPDARVIINGHQEFGSCISCNQKIDVGKYITQISVDCSTEVTGGSANFSMTIPQSELEKFRINGNYLMVPALEVVIFMRGYFPMKNFGGYGEDVEADDFDPNEVPVYPYYQVFRGVTTNVSHDFSGGFYTASVQCSNLIHFWQHQHLSTNGAVLGKRPAGSLVEPRLDGHSFTGANPYSIIYSLVKATFGAAYGVDFMYAKRTDINAVSDGTGQELFTHAAEWWSKRWTENSGRLRMYGINGSLFNHMQQGYYGNWRDNHSEDGFKSSITQLWNAATNNASFRIINQLPKLTRFMRENLYDGVATAAAVSIDSRGRTVVVDDIVKMQAFTFDISRLGSVSLFETEYMTKSEIAAAVCTITGFEFYQDVDGDLVFKPPMYNLDTRSDPVFRIKDRDLISVSESETEPEATMIKGTGSHWANVQGHGVDGWMGVGSVFIDYRLVAKFGYREETFETNYLSNPMAMYISAINRLDIANSGIKSATITIPLRPELRPGYPVYIEHLDCFYYVSSVSHSYSSSSSCTTTISGVAKRSKWFPPMDTAGLEGMPNMENVRLDAPGSFPQKPLMAYPQYIEGASSESQGPPRMVGFPNVVLAMDASEIAADSVPFDLASLDAEQFRVIALNTGFIQRGPDADTLILADGTDEGIEITLEVFKGWTNDILDPDFDITDFSGDGSDNALVQALARIKQQMKVDFDGVDNLINYLALKNSLKGHLAPGSTVQGKYRYYSSSHYLPEHQAPGNLVLTPEEWSVETHDGVADSSTSVYILESNANKGIRVSIGTPSRGIKLAVIKDKVSSSKQHAQVETRIVSTADVRFVSMAPQYLTTTATVSTVLIGNPPNAKVAINNFLFPTQNTQTAFRGILIRKQLWDESLSVKDRIKTGVEFILAALDSFRELGIVSTVLSNPSADPSPAGIDSARANVETLLDGLTDPASGTNPSLGQPISMMVGALWLYLSKMVEGCITGAADEPYDTYEELMSARAAFIVEYTAGAPLVSSITGGTQTVVMEVPVEQTDTGWTPVFPVSDAEGFEVVGNLPYGRGLNIQKFIEIATLTKSVEDQSNGAAAAASSKTTVGSESPIGAADLGTVEDFMSLFAIAKVGLLPDEVDFGSAVTNAFDSSQLAALGAYYNDVNLTDLSTVESLLLSDPSSDIRIRNTPVTSFNRGMSSSEDVSALGIATMDVASNATCMCKGAEQDYYLMAFSEEFVDMFGDDPVPGWVDMNVYVMGEQAAYTKETLAGRVLDTRTTNLAEQFTSRGDVARTYGGDGNVFQQLGEDVGREGQRIAEESVGVSDPNQEQVPGTVGSTEGIDPEET